MSSPLQLLIIAADPLARIAIASQFEGLDGVHVLDQLSPTSILVEELAYAEAEVIVWDIGWETADLLQFDFREVGLPVVALLEDNSQAEALWRAGARGLLSRDAGGLNMLAAARAVGAGLRVWDPRLSSELPASLLGPQESPLLDNLTPRELEVLHLLAEGLANKGIAARLDISEHTVKFHVNSVLSKLDVQSRTEAVVRATRLGLISL